MSEFLKTGILINNVFKPSKVNYVEYCQNNHKGKVFQPIAST